MNDQEHTESRNIIPCPPPTGKTFRNLTGMRFGRLVVEAFYGKEANLNKHTRMWFTCLCDCGVTKVIRKDCLTSGSTTSCGCYQAEQASKAMAITMRTHGKRGTSAYIVWSHMLQRCLNPNDASFKRYGARGITVCERWRLFENFYADMGDPPPGMTLERRDNNLGYGPENCIWANRTAQARNRRSNRLITHNGVTMCAAEWGERIGIEDSIIRARLASGWSVEKALTYPIEVNDGKRSYRPIIGSPNSY